MTNDKSPQKGRDKMWNLARSPVSLSSTIKTDEQKNYDSPA
ncbi:hypothetical protein [Oscillatoria acuminata]|nr:hypothetical protein [Oscillatoria acuminata]